MHSAVPTPFSVAALQRGLRLTLLLTASLGGAYFFSLLFRDFFYWGQLRPRSWSGLPGVFFSAFLHANFSHLFHNSLSLLGLVFLLGLAYPRSAGRLLLLFIVSSGALAWLLASTHYRIIGASGLVYALFGFWLAVALFRRRLLFACLGVVVLFFYSALFRGLWPSQLGMFISQQDPVFYTGHWLGLFAGFFWGAYFRRLSS